MPKAPGFLLQAEEIGRLRSWSDAMEEATKRCPAMDWSMQPRVDKGKLLGAQITIPGEQVFNLPADAMDQLARMILPDEPVNLADRREEAG